MHLKKIIAPFCIAVFVLNACFSPWKGEEALLTLHFDGADAARSLALNNAMSLVAHRVVLDGPSGSINLPVRPGERSFQARVAPGTWSIDITASIHGTPFANGGDRVDVKTGQNNPVSIDMSYLNDNTFFVTNTNDDDDEGSLRWAISEVSDLPGSVIMVMLPLNSEIELKDPLVISSNVIIEGNGVTLRPWEEWPDYGNAFNDARSMISINDDDIDVTIKRIRFDEGKSTEGGAISNNGILTLESCIFSNNKVGPGHGGAISNRGYLIVRGCTFYQNHSSTQGGAIFNSPEGNLALAGNLFYGNTYNDIEFLLNILHNNGNFSSPFQYNIVDALFGTTNIGSHPGKSGWDAGETDDQVPDRVFSPANGFKLYAPAMHRVHFDADLPADYPELDFYGNPITAFNWYAGAVQESTNSGWAVDFMFGRHRLTTRYVDHGEAVERPEYLENTPGLDFDGWYKDDGFETLWVFPVVNQNPNQQPFFITTNTTIYGDFNDEGYGSPNEPIRINNAADLQRIGKGRSPDLEWFGDWAMDAHYWLVSDIDLEGIDWEPIGDQVLAFSGTFHGGNHTIYNLTIDRSDESYLGLFGYIEGGLVENLWLVDVDIRGSANVGGIAGNNSWGGSMVRNCHVTGKMISGSGGSVGGIAGSNGISSTIENCSVISESISGSNGVGGIVGHNNGAVKNSFFSGNVNGTSDDNASHIGGIVGVNQNNNPEIPALVENCYAIGTVSGRHNLGGIVGSNNATGTNIVRNNVALNLAITTTDPIASGHGRVVGSSSSNSTLTNNYAWSGMEVNGELVDDGEADNIHGANVTAEDVQTQDWWIEDDRWYTVTPAFAWVFIGDPWTWNIDFMPSLHDSEPIEWPEYLVDD